MASHNPIKVTLLGPMTVGKSSIAYYLYTGKICSMIDMQSTIGCAFMRYKHLTDNDIINFNIWDLSGSETYQSVVGMYLRNVQVILLVYDASNEESYKEIVRIWIPYVKEKILDEDPVICLVSNKIDRGEDVELREKGRTLAESNGYLFWRTSAQTGDGIKELFAEIVIKLKDKSQPKPSEGITLLHEPKDIKCMSYLKCNT